LNPFSQEIQDQLKSGAELWNRAKGDFNTTRRKMNEETKLLERRPTKRDWIAFLWLVSLIFVFGMVLGIVLRR